MVKRISNFPFRLPINEFQLRCFVYKQMSMYDQHLHFNIYGSKKILANGDLRKVWKRATPFVTRAGWFERRLTLTFSIIFSCLEMFFTSNVWRSLTLLQLKTTEHLTKK